MVSTPAPCHFEPSLNSNDYQRFADEANRHFAGEIKF